MPLSPHFRGRESIVIPEDDDPRRSEAPQTEQRLDRLRQARASLIDLTLDEERAQESAHYIQELEQELDDDLRIIGVGPVPARNPEVPKRRQHGSYRYKGFLIKQDTVVEVDRRPPREYKWQFLQVKSIYTNEHGEVMLRGIRLTRLRFLRGMLPRLRNEVCALLDVDETDTRADLIQAAFEVPVADIIRTRALFRTNAKYPEHREVENEDRACLVQRWTFIRYFASYRAISSGKFYSGAFIRLRSRDISDPKLKVSDDELRNEFRGGVIRGGAFNNGKYTAPTISLDSEHRGTSPTTTRKMGRDQRYTADDMFCGAGGASRGMKQAGFKLALACDHDERACQSYRANNFEADLREENIFDLVRSLKSQRSLEHPDVLHISPPCQFFSPAHTHPGQNDGANIAALYACAQVLERRRPRLSTGEQTFGLLHPKHEEYFFLLVRQYTDLGYSFRWKLMHFKDYGIASTRKRLVWIAACPGEALPDFPAPTHSDTNPSLLPHVFLSQVLTSIKPNHLGHNVAEMLKLADQHPNFPKPSYDANILVDTITTAGSLKSHPSGHRNFTIREQAALQSFPAYHRFVGPRSTIIKQIGNAFPPLVVKSLYTHLRNWLLEQDRVKEVGLPGDVIDLDELPIRPKPIVIADSSSEPELDPIVIEDDEDTSRRGVPLVLDSIEEDVRDCPMLVIDSDNEVDDRGSRASSCTLAGSDEDVMMSDRLDMLNLSRDNSPIFGEEDDVMTVEDANDFEVVKTISDMMETRRA
ncbi:S-adenosyl-L-methionine-dependent methyltransferase [Xylariaceae sp. FL1019]|nr:S-adenosyl-L-methionine-dependent methyltransferase [Xylariaceae sp. FL1019]